MNSMTLSEALSIRAAFTTMKKKLSDEGIDTSDVQYITDLPGVLCSLVPDDMAEAADALLGSMDEETLSSLLTSFSAAASCGGMVSAIMGLLPTDNVKEGDLYA